MVKKIHDYTKNPLRKTDFKNSTAYSGRRLIFLVRFTHPQLPTKEVKTRNLLEASNIHIPF